MHQIYKETANLGESGECERLRLEISQLVKQQGGRRDAPQDAENIVAEVLDNINEHAVYRDEDTAESEGIVCIILLREGDRIIIEFRDRALPFDPFASQKGTERSEDQSFGGYGIKIVSKLADGLAYSRDGAENVLTVELLLK